MTIRCRKNDVYLGHRVIHALESAEWIKLSSSSADLTIYAGDFNTEPVDVPYALLRLLAPLTDSWTQANGSVNGELTIPFFAEDDNCDDTPYSVGGETCGTPQNSYTPPNYIAKYPEGKRIDYVLYQGGPNVDASAVQCDLPLPGKVPGKEFRY